MKHLVYYLLVGTRGGVMRAKLLCVLKARPMNAHRLAKALGVDYKTVQHHVRVLFDNNLITAVRKGSYGAVYFISPELEAVWNDFRAIWERMGKNNLNKKQRW